MLEAFGDVVLGVVDAAQHAKVGIGAGNELVKPAKHPGLRILGTDFDVAACHEQLGLAHQALNALLQLGIPLPVLEALVGQDALDRLLLGDRNVLADVFLRPLVHQQVAHQAFIWRHQDQQFVPPHALHPQDGLAFGIFMERADDMDRQLVFAPMQPIIELAGERVVLPVLVVADLPVLDDVVEDDLLQLSGNV